MKFNKFDVRSTAVKASFNAGFGAGYATETARVATQSLVQRAKNSVFGTMYDAAVCGYDEGKLAVHAKKTEIKNPAVA